MSQNEIEDFEKYFSQIPKSNNLSSQKNEQEKLIEEDKFAIIKLKSDLKKAEEDKRILEKQILNLEKILELPLSEISKKSEFFKVNYEELMVQYAYELTLQKAYKELSIQLGQKLNYKKDQVILMAQEKCIGVLENRHNPIHSTVASGCQIIVSRLSKLKELFRKK